MLNNDSKVLFKAAGLGVLISYVASAVLMLLSSIVMTLVDFGDCAANIFSIVILAVSSLFCGFTASKILKGRGITVGALSGLIYYISLAVISAIMTGGGFTKMFFIKFIISVLLSVIGGIVAGINQKNNSIKI